jgi:hypothetical protein
MVQVSNNSAFTSIAATFLQAETWPEHACRSELHPSSTAGRITGALRAIHTAGRDRHEQLVRHPDVQTPAPPRLQRRAWPCAVTRRWWRRALQVVATSASAAAARAMTIAECIEARYPQYRKSGVSVDTRKANCSSSAIV